MTRAQEVQKPGHQKLQEDISEIKDNIDKFVYHDFKNTMFPFPKVALIQKLEWVIRRVKEGQYDNDPEDPEMKGDSNENGKTANSER